jgi:hypothetical protein
VIEVNVSAAEAAEATQVVLVGRGFESRQVGS